jgi:hypothetical protein
VVLRRGRDSSSVPSTEGYVSPLDELPYRSKKRRKQDCGRWAWVVLDGLSDWTSFFSLFSDLLLPFLLKLLGIRGKKEGFQKVAKQV